MGSVMKSLGFEKLVHPGVLGEQPLLLDVGAQRCIVLGRPVEHQPLTVGRFPLRREIDRLLGALRGFLALLHELAHHGDQRIGAFCGSEAVEPVLLDDPAQQAPKLGRIHDVRPLRQAEHVPEARHQPRPERVEGAHLHAPGGIGADELFQPLGHLLRGLVGEGHREDRFRPRTVGEQAQHPRDDRPRLAGSRSGEDNQRRAGMIDGTALFIIQCKRSELLAGANGDSPIAAGVNGFKTEGICGAAHGPIVNSTLVNGSGSCVRSARNLLISDRMLSVKSVLFVCMGNICRSWRLRWWPSLS